MTHELKILPKYFEDIIIGKKNFEIRKNDRDYKVGDYILLKEWQRGKYTGRQIKKRVQYIYFGDVTYGLMEEYCILALEEEQPTGEWIESDIEDSVLAKCSICGFDCGSITYNYCPNCGARMGKEYEEV